MVAVASAQPGPSSECWQNAANTPHMSEISESDGSATLLVCIFICAKENRSAGPSCGNGMRLLADQNCRQILTADVRNSHCQRQNSQQTYHHTTHTTRRSVTYDMRPHRKTLTYVHPTYGQYRGNVHWLASPVNDWRICVSKVSLLACSCWWQL